MRKIAFFCMLGWVMPVSAIVVENYDLAEAAPSAADPALDLDWGYVYNYKGSSAVAVDAHWILTAAHVANDSGNGSLTIDEMVYTQQEIVYHPTVDGYAPDLALVRYDKVFPGSYDLYTGALYDTPRLEVLMVGFGNIGVATNSTNFTDSGTGSGTKRWGSQQIDRTYKKSVAEPSIGLTKTIGLEMDFILGSTNNSTTYEAGGGLGDSGGGVFYHDGDGWRLAGIMTSRSSVSGGFENTFAASVPRYADWITDTIPEPAAIGLMGFGTIGLLLARSRRRRKLAGRSLFPIRGDEPICDRYDAMEGSEDVQKREYADYLAGMLQMIHASPLSLWMNALHTRYNAFNKALWRLIIATVERSAERKEAAGERVNIVFVKHLDLFLEKITWDRTVAAVRSGRTKATQAVRKAALKSMDAFLEIIPWDKMVSMYRRCRKAIWFR